MNLNQYNVYLTYIRRYNLNINLLANQLHVLFKSSNRLISLNQFRLNFCNNCPTACIKANADEHGQPVAHAQDVVDQVGRPQQQRRGDAKGGVVSKIVQFRT